MPWVSIPSEQLVKPIGPLGQRTFQCLLCGAKTISSEDATARQQIAAHLQRDHGCLIEDATGRTSRRLRLALIDKGWTPPVEDVS